MSSRGKWWERFNDPRLNELEEKLNISNQNIAAAAANVQAARAMIREARAQYFPTVAADPGISNSHFATGFGKALGITFTHYSCPFDASWEPDLWGRVRNTVKANTFAAQATVADLENVRLSAQTELAADYQELRAQDALKQLLDSTVSAYQEALDLTRDRYLAGHGFRRGGGAGRNPVRPPRRKTRILGFSALSMSMRSRFWRASLRRRLQSRWRP